MIASLERAPQPLRDSVSMSRRTQRLACISTPSSFPVAGELDVQKRRRLTVAHADTVTARSFTQEMITLGQGQQRRWRAVTGTDNERMSKWPHRFTASMN
jgi:hypothetical protein